MNFILRLFYRLCFGLLIFFIALGAIALGLLQTNRCKEYLLHILASEGEKKGICFTVKDLSGLAPFKWSLKEASFHFNTGETLLIQDAKLRIAFFPLLKGQLSISFLQANYVAFSFREEPAPGALPSSFVLPFHLSARTIKIKELVLKNEKTKQNLHLSLNGKGKIERTLEELQIDFQILQPSLGNTLEIQMISSKKKGIIHAKSLLHVESSQNISQFFHLPCNGSTDLSIRCWGQWSFWDSLKERSSAAPLLFALKGKIEDLSIPDYPFLQTSWSIQTDLSLWPDLSSQYENCSLESNCLSFFGRVRFSPSFRPLLGSAVIELLELSVFSPFLPFPIQGTMGIRGGISEKAFVFSASSPSLMLKETLFSPVTFEIKAREQDGVWSGLASSELQNTQLPWKGSLDFSFENHSLQAHDLTIQTGDITLSGKGSWNPWNDAFTGSFFILAPELKPFRALFPNSSIQGKIGGAFSFEKQQEKLFIQTDLLAKNIRYQNSLVDMLKVEASLHDFLNTPSGSLSLFCENFWTQEGHIAHLFFSSLENEKKEQSFALDMQGHWKQDFSFSTQGLLHKDRKNWLVSCNSGHGYLFGYPFSLAPCTWGCKGQEHFLDHGLLELDEGSLFLHYSLGPDAVEIETKATHLPLYVFSLLYPAVSLTGLTSFEGSFSALKDNYQGHFLASLEEINLSSTKAKGAVQVHLSSCFAQVHAHIQAMNNQFLDWTGTFPLSYSLFPFSIQVDKTRPLSSDFTSQGAIEHLLRFIQSGSQKMSGWLTSHLLLSGTFLSPRVYGSIDLQKGSYESYISGSRLQNINASLAGQGPSLDISSFLAEDTKGGTLTAQGTLLLKEGSFDVSADLHKFHSIRTESLHVETTGPLHLKGDTKKASLAGQFDVNKATFTLSENLLLDLPSLPIHYINKPIHLQQSELIQKPEYPLGLDVSFQANDTVHIKGKGLDSNWQGHLELKGTQSEPTFNGILTLKSGEFKFAGKTFLLTQGALSFSDKPGENTYLKISGQLQLQEATVIINMQGPLTDPKITFQSTPALPTSSILALILFNKDISEISPVQALQLAQVIMSLSGKGGPDVLEAIRKTLGVDRFNISGKDGSDEIVFQIGWYLTHGITVSLSQSATSSDITVEVDLKNGFVFEAETQNQEEGKFSLKWNKYY